MAEAAPGKLTRQELYDKIRETSKDEYILSEMKRLGFWKESEGAPKLSEELITRKGELSRELQDLMKTQRMLQDPEKALKEFRKQRMKEAKAKREETKQKQAHERHQRAVKWHERQQNEITYLGEDVSIGLSDKQIDMAKLRNQGLPVIHNAKALANSMGITLNELRFLSYNRKVSKVNHYKRFLISKKTGGERLISAPMPRLKRAQYWILENVLLKINCDECAHGFVPGKSIVTNAEQHIGKDVVINLDLKNFFPTIDYKRIKGLFQKLGYSEEISVVFALICSEPEIQEVELDNESWNIAKSKRHMPQGAPTSPVLSNLICRRLDKRLKGLATKFGFTYTRYADDLTFSASGPSASDAGKLLRMVSEIVENEGFIVHPEKTRIMRKGRHQEVTGITVNEKLSIDKKTLKKFRALLFQIEKDGPEGKSWGAGNVLSSIQGYANYVAMVSPEKGKGLKAKAAQLVEQYGSGKTSQSNSESTTVSKERFRKLSAEGKAPKQDWKMAQASEGHPELEKTDAQIKEEKQQARKQEQADVQQDNTTQSRQNRLSNIRQQVSIPDDRNAELEKAERWSMIFIALAVCCFVLAIWWNLK